jgi:arylsulfatase A-like enzyme
MKKLFLFLTLACLCAVCGNVCAEKLPNIVVVLGDDHGVRHSAPYGSKEIRTPNMQAMADEGMVFDRAYVASPSCCPSRTAMLTGLMPENNGVVGNHESDKLKPGTKSLMIHLIDLGYAVIWTGKVAHGTTGPELIDAQIKVIPGSGRGIFTRIETIERHLGTLPKSRPVAVFIGTTDTHTPWPKPEDVRITPNRVELPPKTYDTPEARREMGRYIEAVETVDRIVGRVRGMIQTHLDTENTLLLYTSDHGQAWPFGKWGLYEDGIRTSLLTVWPGRIKPGVRTDAMVSWIDILPTFIDIAGGKVPEGIDGRSFKGVLLGETDTHRDRIFAIHKGDKQMNVYPMRSVRVGKWKYILNLHPEFYYTTHMDLVPPGTAHSMAAWPSWVEAAKNDPEAAAFLRAYHARPGEELYDLEADPDETTNLAGKPEYKAPLEELRAQVRNRMKEVNDDESLSGEPRLRKDYKLP